MHKFHYKYVKNKFDTKLLFTDTDSLKSVKHKNNKVNIDDKNKINENDKVNRNDKNKVNKDDKNRSQ